MEPLSADRAFTLSCLRINKYITLPKGTVERQSDNQLHYIILPNESPRYTTEARMVIKKSAESSWKNFAIICKTMIFT